VKRSGVKGKRPCPFTPAHLVKFELAFTLSLVATLCEAQPAKPNSAKGAVVDVGGSRIWYEECGSAVYARGPTVGG